MILIYISFQFSLQDNPKLGRSEFKYLSDLDTCDDFYYISEELNRNVEQAKRRWRLFTLPVLKSYDLKLPNFPQCYFSWMDDFLDYIVKEKIRDGKDIDFGHVENHVCRGQTSASLKKFVKDISYKSNKKLVPHESLHEICYRRLCDYAANDPNNEAKQKEINTKRNKSIERIEEIVNIYKMLKKEEE